MRFWDSSAVVPLVVEQKGSREAREWIAQDSRMVIWTLTTVEVVSAIRRLVRNGALDESLAIDAEDRAADLSRLTNVVSDVERVKSLACRMLRVHPLRAADALQLGAALAWADGDPAGRILHTLDQRLALAARREGFGVRPG